MFRYARAEKKRVTVGGSNSNMPRKTNQSPSVQNDQCGNGEEDVIFLKREEPISKKVKLNEDQPSRRHLYKCVQYSRKGERILSENVEKTYQFILKHYVVPSGFDTSYEYGALSGVCHEDRVIAAYMWGQLRQKDAKCGIAVSSSSTTTQQSDKKQPSPEEELSIFFPIIRIPSGRMKMCRDCGDMGHFPRDCPKAFY